MYFFKPDDKIKTEILGCQTGNQSAEQIDYKIQGGIAMRLRNIPHADSVVQTHKAVIMEPEKYRGCWRQIFGNAHPIHIEIGMGKGKFLLQMAAAHPEINFIGMERYSSVLLRALEKYDTEEFQKLENVRFLCMDAGDLENISASGEAARIYLNFSDPWPKARHARRRLTSSVFLEKYHQVLIPGGRLEFKTDNKELFEFSMEQVKKTAGWTLETYTCDLHHDEVMNAGNIMTEYEEKFSGKGNPIYKMNAVRD